VGLKPYFRLEANGADITPKVLRRLVRLRLVDEVGEGADSVEIVLDDTGGTIPLPRQGASLEVWLGWDGAGTKMGRYTVDEVELSGAPDVLTIRGRSAPFIGEATPYKALTSQKSRSWDLMTIDLLVAAIAGEHGLRPIVGPEFIGQALPHLDQFDESDINLLRRVMMDRDAAVKVNGGCLLVVKRAKGQNSAGAPLVPVVLTPGEVSSRTVTITGRAFARSVIATWNDIQTGQLREARAGSGEPVKRLRNPLPNQEAAQRAADAAMEAGRRGHSTLSVTLPGRPALQSEATLTMQGFREGVDGEWLIQHVAHNLTAEGYTCEVEAITP
jgi:phage protein D